MVTRIELRSQYSEPSEHWQGNGDIVEVSLLVAKVVVRGSLTWIRGNTFITHYRRVWSQTVKMANSGANGTSPIIWQLNK